MAALTISNMGCVLSEFYDEISDLHGETQSMILMFPNHKTDSTSGYKIAIKGNENLSEKFSSVVQSVSSIEGIDFTRKDMKNENKVRELWRHCTENEENISSAYNSLQWTVSEFKGFCVILFTYTPTIRRTRRCYSNLDCLDHF